MDDPVSESLSGVNNPEMRFEETEGGLNAEALRKSDAGQLMRADMAITLHGVHPQEVTRLLAGGASDFTKSFPCETLHAFLSHSWRGSWWQKIVCILFYNYYIFSFLAGLATALIVALYSWAYELPERCMPGGGEKLCSKGFSGCYAGSFVLLVPHPWSTIKGLTIQP